MIEWPAGARSIRFELRDRLRHPEFSWPRTLLTYRVRWAEPAYTSDQLRMVDGSGTPVALQLSEVRREGGLLADACVSVLADLPSGGSREFTLCTDGPSVVGNSLVVAYEAGSIVVDTGALRVRLPSDRDGDAPGPILQFDRGTGWLGRSVLRGAPPVRRLRTTLLDAGSLFVSFRLTYEFEGSAHYVATVRCIAGYDHVELDEKMSGLGDAVWELEWTGFSPTHRFSSTWPYSQDAADHLAPGSPEVYHWLPIDEPLVIGDTGEDPAFFGRGRLEDPSREFAFTVGPYAPSYAFDVRPHATFWDIDGGDSAGVFVLRPERWDDQQYALWASSQALQIRFRYADGLLRWTWPLRDGTRRTGVACYDHSQDFEVPREFQTTYVRQLHHWHSTLSLDLVKDWQLWYDGTRPTSPYCDGRLTSPDELVDELFTGKEGPRLIARGVNDVAGYSNIGQRPLYDRLIDAYARLSDKLDPAERERVEALLLLNAYVAAGEEIGPMLRMLGGHPNFMADGKAALACFAWLFPEHPEAAGWLNRFEKFVELVAAFHTRPAVGDALGGRWTESLATYVWAFLRPTVLGNLTGMLADGRNRLADPNLAEMSDWLVQSLSVPMVFGGRVHPPQGAHAFWPRRPPLEMWLLAQALQRYQPLVAEHLMWGSSPDAWLLEHRSGAPDPWRFAVEPGSGTNPRLRSTKHSGYGATLRADVDRPTEIAVFLQQTDPGPNYRWGVPGDNSSGTIYYYANGRSYSGHGPEDAGDRRAPSATYTSSFGVWSDGSYRSIGPNSLDRPLYDLGWAQHAEITSADGERATYRSRSVTLVGSDYIAVYDAVAPNQRTAWTWSTATAATGWDANSVDEVADELPFIHIVRGVRTDGELEGTFSTEVCRGVHLESAAEGTGGNTLAVVSHRHDLTVAADRSTPWGAQVTTPEGVDYVFQHNAGTHYQPREISVDEGGVHFTGTAGVIRLCNDGERQLALFHGSRIGTDELMLTTADPELGISVRYRNVHELKGVYVSPSGSSLTLSVDVSSLYVDGSPIAFTGAQVDLPAGRHQWELTVRKPEPLPPEIVRAEHFAGGATVHLDAVPAAEYYEIQLSRDGGVAWEVSATTSDDFFVLTSLTEKVHVRAVACNTDQRSAPGREYPIYPTAQPPPPPDGLRLRLGRGVVTATWGEVLGATSYRLYRRRAGTTDYEEIFRGLAHQYVDESANGVVEAYSDPGDGPEVSTYEYAVAAENGNGVGARSTPIDTDPRSCRNWRPPGGITFRPQHTYNQLPYFPLREGS